MGLAESKPKKSSLGQLKAQIARIGNQNPFGDDEILRLSRCFAYLNSSRFCKHENDGYDRENLTRRWLTDLAVFSSTLPPADFSASSGDDCLAYVDLLMVDRKLLKPASIEVLEQRKRIKYILTVIE